MMTMMMNYRRWSSRTLSPPEAQDEASYGFRRCTGNIISFLRAAPWGEWNFHCQMPIERHRTYGQWSLIGNLRYDDVFAAFRFFLMC